MKKLLLIFVFACSVQIPFAQVILPVGPATIDSLKAELKKTSNDTLRLVLVNELRFNYFFGKGDFDSALVYSKQVLGLAQKMGYKIDEAYAYDLLADIFNFQHHDQTLETFFRGIKIAEDPRSEKKILPRKYLEKMTYWHKDFNALLVKNNWSTGYFRLAILGSLYQDLGRAYGKVMPDQQKLFFYLTKAINLYTSQKDSAGLIHTYSNIAEYFYARDQLDSSLSYIQKADALQQLYTRSSQLFLLYPLWGTLHFRKGNYPLSLRLLRQSITPGNEFEKGWNWLAYVTLAEYFLKTGQLDSSLYYGREAHILTTKTNLPDTRQTTSALLARLYESTGARDSALEYYKLALSLNDSVNNFSKRAQLQRQDFEQQRQQDELEQEKARVKSYALLAGLAILLTIALFLLRNNQQRKKTNTALHQKNGEIERTLTELKVTQAQLIQSEKMASLGELTAGIAHEIQNPLNFVNNFSDVNTELIEELAEEAEKGNIDEVRAIAKDISDNEEKINHHGKRADAIVKGMLQHSRANTGKKEPADINALADEYLRLSYHGLRAKDKSFNADFKTYFDESIGKVNVVPQDIGRVLLNLYNNAFYSVNEKKKAATVKAEKYEPIVEVSTKKVGDKIQIGVRDNGTGIPQKILDKVYQPFFTTKPTGQGTGLGLSLSYDIIQAHGGELKVDTKEGEGVEFIIQLPSR